MNFRAEEIGILFSGGLDSSILAKIGQDLEPEIVLYCAGFPRSKRVRYLYGEWPRVWLSVPGSCCAEVSDAASSRAQNLQRGFEEHPQIQRLVAKDLGLPAQIYERTKPAAQFGAGTNKVLDILAVKKMCLRALFQGSTGYEAEFSCM